MKKMSETNEIQQDPVIVLKTETQGTATYTVTNYGHTYIDTTGPVYLSVSTHHSLQFKEQLPEMNMYQFRDWMIDGPMTFYGWDVEDPLKNEPLNITITRDLRKFAQKLPFKIFDNYGGLPLNMRQEEKKDKKRGAVIEMSSELYYSNTWKEHIPEFLVVKGIEVPIYIDHYKPFTFGKKT